MIQLPFMDREKAGRSLGAKLADRRFPESTIVLGLARGGVVVGFWVADKLEVPLDIVVVRKVGVPDQPELAMGAIAGGEVQTLDDGLIRQLGICEAEVEEVVAKEKAEAARRERVYREGRPAPDLHGRVVILVDDGLATGSSMLAAVRYVKSLRPASVVVAVPVGSRQACALLKKEAGDCECLATPEPFRGVGAWYVNFGQTTDQEVEHLLEQSRRRLGALNPRSGSVSTTPVW
jgi:putative phosphoribosyl transferase